MDLRDKVFDLVENENGLAESTTRMVFKNCTNPYEATYSGPNISNGHVLVSNLNDILSMIYHAYTNEGDLVAGKASVTLNEIAPGKLSMQLNWQWLTGNLTSGTSNWIQVKT